MRLVLDTKVIVSGLLWRGAPNKLIELASQGDLALFTSKTLRDELRAVLERPKWVRAVAAAGMSANNLARQYQRLAHRVAARQLSQRISREADHDHVLACGLAAKAGAIVSGDADLFRAC